MHRGQPGNVRKSCLQPDSLRCSRAGLPGGLSRIERLIAVVLVLVGATVGSSEAVRASTDPSALCERAAIVAAGRTGVPISVLKAIMLTETGRQSGNVMRPWPWTVNMEGKGRWFDSASAAIAYAEEHNKRGATSFDVGCFQINYKWHHQNFTALDVMFNPLENALYAAEFLADLYSETSDWEAAAGAYHSRTPDYADAYRVRFAGFRKMFLAEDGRPLPDLATIGEDWPEEQERDVVALPGRTDRENTFPLLKAGSERGLGSLVPMSESGVAQSLFAPGDAG